MGARAGRTQQSVPGRAERSGAAAPTGLGWAKPVRSELASEDIASGNRTGRRSCGAGVDGAAMGDRPRPHRTRRGRCSTCRRTSCRRGGPSWVSWAGWAWPCRSEHGGQGYGLPEMVVVLEELGRVCAPGPILPTVVAATAIDRWGPTGAGSSAGRRARWWAASLPHPTWRRPRRRRCVPRVSGTAGGGVGRSAGRPVRAARRRRGAVRWCVVDRGDVEVRELPGLDATSRLAEVRVDDVVVPPSGGWRFPGRPPRAGPDPVGRGAVRGHGRRRGRLVRVDRGRPTPRCACSSVVRSASSRP